MVLDILRLINDFIAEFFSLIERGVPAQCIIGSDQDIIPVISSDFFPSLFLAARDHRGRQFRSKPPDLFVPIIHKRGRGDHKRRSAPAFLLRRQQQRNDLKGFPKSHIIRQYTSQIPFLQRTKPFKTVFLIITQDGRKAFRLLELRIIDRLKLFDHFSEMGISFTVQFVILCKHAVQIQRPVQRQMHFPFYHIRRLKRKRRYKFIHCFKRRIIQPDIAPVLQPMIPLLFPVALQKVKQLSLFQSVCRHFQLQQPI